MTREEYAIKIRHIQDLYDRKLRRDRLGFVLDGVILGLLLALLLALTACQMPLR